MQASITTPAARFHDQAPGPFTHRRPTDGPALSGARLLHTMIRVGDLDRALDFYVGLLGMTLLRTVSFDEQRFTLAFLGYGPEETQAVIELTWNWDRQSYEIGSGFGHIAIAVADIRKAVDRLAAEGVEVVRPVGPLKGSPGEIIAFVLDPDGYRIELIERA